MRAAVQMNTASPTTAPPAVPQVEPAPFSVMPQWSSPHPRPAPAMVAEISRESAAKAGAVSRVARASFDKGSVIVRLP